MDGKRFAHLVKAFVRGELKDAERAELMEACRLEACQRALLHYLHCGRFPALVAA